VGLWQSALSVTDQIVMLLLERSEVGQSSSSGVMVGCNNRSKKVAPQSLYKAVGASSFCTSWWPKQNYIPQQYG